VFVSVSVGAAGATGGRASGGRTNGPCAPKSGIAASAIEKAINLIPMGVFITCNPLLSQTG